MTLAESPHSGSNLHTSMKGFYVALRTTCGETQVITLPLNYCIPPPKEQVKNFDSDIEQPMVFWICSSPCGLTFSCLGHLGNFALPAFFELSFSLPKIHFMAFFLSHCLCLHTSLHTHRYVHTCIAWMNTTLLSWKMQAPLSQHFPRLASLSKTFPTSNTMFFGSALSHSKFEFPAILVVICLFHCVVFLFLST